MPLSNNPYRAGHKSTHYFSVQLLVAFGRTDSGVVVEDTGDSKDNWEWMTLASHMWPEANSYALSLASEPRNITNFNYKLDNLGGGNSYSSYNSLLSGPIRSLGYKSGH